MGVGVVFCAIGMEAEVKRREGRGKGKGKGIGKEGQKGIGNGSNGILGVELEIKGKKGKRNE